MNDAIEAPGTGAYPRVHFVKEPRQSAGCGTGTSVLYLQRSASSPPEVIIEDFNDRGKVLAVHAADSYTLVVFGVEEYMHIHVECARQDTGYRPPGRLAVHMGALLASLRQQVAIIPIDGDTSDADTYLVTLSGAGYIRISTYPLSIRHLSHQPMC